MLYKCLLLFVICLFNSSRLLRSPFIKILSKDLLNKGNTPDQIPYQKTSDWIRKNSINSELKNQFDDLKVGLKRKNSLNLSNENENLKNYRKYSLGN